MATFYNRQNMTASCSPVTVGDQFKFNYRNCIVTKVYNNCFEWESLNPSLKNKRKVNIITFQYWQENVFYHFNTPILKGDWQPPVLKKEYPKRELRRMGEKLISLSKQV